MGHMASKPEPGVPLEVVGCGMSRTGTSSFTQALVILLGDPVYHAGSQIAYGDDAHMRTLIDMYEHTPIKSQTDRDIVDENLRKLTTGYRGLTDAPIAVFAEELVHLYPNAKFICTVRDPEKWWKSMEPVAKASDSRPTLMRMWVGLTLALVPGLRYWNEFCDKASAGRYGELFYQSGHQKPHPGQYAEHMEYIRRVVPAERLHYFNVKDGWEPLCKILNKPVPNIPFPRSNEGEATAGVIKEVTLKGLQRWMIVIGGVIVTGWGVKLVLFAK